mmetsp:Transcript_99110/g.212352  ORF Transcript_99110/g.212352 Transcript_99110/m.212352 type:complete len:629 (-) Transcript_99110:75-1961(-)
MPRGRQPGRGAPPPPLGDAQWRRPRRGSADLCVEMAPSALTCASCEPQFLQGVPPPGPTMPSGRQAQFESVIWEFKTKPCYREGSQSASHDHRCCPFFHGERDRRRLVFAEDGSEETLYRAEPCGEQFDDRRQCSRGDQCDLCHSTAELLYHPEFFRKRLCHQSGRCPRGRLCAFAHNRQELLVPFFSEAEETDPSEEFIAYNFKTQWCPIGGPHDWENCVYAHTYRDWRRSPGIGYSSWPCPQWTKSISSGGAELMYQDRCPHGMACAFAHGAKEQLYHPQFYKTSPCSECNCKRGALCAFTHDARDTRQVSRDETGPGPHAERAPLPWAEEILSRVQPTFRHPPRYHAFEDSFREYNNNPGYSKGRNSNPKSARKATNARARARDWRQPAADPYYCGDGGGDEASPASSSQAYLPYAMCQWMPCAEASGQLMPAPMGYSEAADPWGAQAAYGYAAMGQVVWGTPLPQQCVMDVVPNSQPTQLEPSRQHQGAVRTGFDFGPVDMVGIPHLAAGEAGGQLTWDWNQNYSSSGEQFAANSGAWQAPNLARFLGVEHFDKLPIKSKSRKGAGMRTPSSLGSPVESATPTEEPSPRQPEATSSSQDGQADSISDDTALDALVSALVERPNV